VIQRTGAQMIVVHLLERQGIRVVAGILVLSVSKDRV
jgi:hypothetical protein